MLPSFLRKLALGKAFENSKTFLLRWGSLSKSRKRFFYVWEAFRNLENVSFALGKPFENSKTLLSRWGSLSKSRKRSLCARAAIAIPSCCRRRTEVRQQLHLPKPVKFCRPLSQGAFYQRPLFGEQSATFAESPSQPNKSHHTSFFVSSLNRPIDAGLSPKSRGAARESISSLFSAESGFFAEAAPS